MQKIKFNKKYFLLLSLIFAGVVFWLITYIFSNLYFKKVYVIKITTTISYDKLDIDKLAKFLRESKGDGYIFYIDSPGGYIESYKLIEVVKSINKPKVCYIHKYGASAAYWLCVNTNKIIAEPFAITGSVGGIIEYLNFAELLKKLGIRPVIIKEGDLKDIGNPFRNTTPIEYSILRNKLKLFVDLFRKDVLKHRNITNVSLVFSGQWFFGIEAKKLGLVDEIGDYDLAKEEIAKLLNTTTSRIMFVEVDFAKKESLINKIIKSAIDTIVDISLKPIA